MDSSYGAIDENNGEEPGQHVYNKKKQKKSHSSLSKFTRQSSYSSNAASIEYLEMEGPRQVVAYNEYPNKFSSSFNLEIAAEPREVYKANHSELGSQPSDNLKCLWLSICILFVLTIAASLCIDEYMINLYGSSSQSGLYFWSFGWNGSSFKAGESQLSADQVPLTFTKRYAVDAGRMLIVSLLIIIVCLSFICIILCSRCTNNVYLYIKCCTIQIPQAPSLYILFSTIKHFSRISLYFYLFTIVHGMLEMNFYANFVCQSIGGTCTNFAVPHIGMIALFFMSITINCFVTQRILKLDQPFNAQTIGYYYPDHGRKMNLEKYEHIKLGYLKQSLHCIRIMIICAIAMFVGFESVGMILIADWNKTTPSFSLFFQFYGFSNEQFEEISEAHRFTLVCWVIQSVFLPFVIIFNVFALVYFYFVIISFRSFGCFKFMLVSVMLFEWFLFTALIGSYYFTFYVFWSDYLEQNTEKSNYYNAENEYELFWLPDWGILVALIIDWYLIKLIAFTLKAI